MALKETREMVVLIAQTANTVSEVLEDKKFSLAESLKFIPVLMKISPAVNGMDQIQSELENATAEERQELINEVKAELEFSDNVEAIIEESIVAAVSIVKIIRLIRK